MKLHFDFRDIFRAPRIALRFQRLWINGLGLSGGYLVFWVFTYLSLVIDGGTLSQVWARYGLLPYSYNQLENWYSLTIFLAGTVIFFAIFLLTNTAVSRVAYAELRREVFYTWRQAFRFAFRKWVSVIGAMLTFLFMISFIAVGAIVVSFIGRIPVVGELGSFLLIIPYILAALLLLFICIVACFAIFLVPAIIATSEEDSLGGVFQSFSIAFSQPFRLIGYSVLTGFLEISGIVVLAFFVKKAYLVFAGLFKVGMGEKFGSITEHGFSLIDKALPQLYGWMQYLFGSFSGQIYLSYHHSPATLSISEDIAAYIFLVFILVIGGAVLAFGEAIRNTGFTILYVDLYKTHENENLLDREDSELNPDLEEMNEEPIQKEDDSETDAGN
jgi:hypothetical protein